MKSLKGKNSAVPTALTKPPIEHSIGGKLTIGAPIVIIILIHSWIKI